MTLSKEYTKIIEDYMNNQIRQKTDRKSNMKKYHKQREYGSN